MIPSFDIPWPTQAFLIALAAVAMLFVLKERLFPVTLEDIEKMDFQRIVDYLEDTPVTDRSGPLWSAAVDRGINIWTPTVDLGLTKRFRFAIHSPKHVDQIKRFNVRVGLSAFGSLGPIT